MQLQPSMKSLFKGFYKLSDQEIQGIWENGFISFDTNVLFNIYRYSEETRKELLRVIRKYSSQLWLPYHAAFEFHKNRISVISDQVTVYEETIKAFDKLETDIIKNHKTPHLSKSVQDKFEKTIKETVKDLNKKKDYYKKLLSTDNILNSITTIFNNKVGEGFTVEEIQKIEKDGEERYKKKIPPGFKDNAKSENKFGDLIIWKELIKKAKAESKDFILIIDDLKEDWWLRTQGQTISPRQELSQELYQETGQSFHLYTPDRFLEFAAKSEEINQEAIDEVREIRLEANIPYSKYPDFATQLPTYFPDSIYSSKTLQSLEQLKHLSGLQESFKPSTKLSELVKNSDFMKNLDTLQSLSNIAKTIPNFNHQAYTNLQDLSKTFAGGGLAKSLMPEYFRNKKTPNSDSNTDGKTS